MQIIVRRKISKRGIGVRAKITHYDWLTIIMIIIIISKHTNQNTLFQDKTTERYFHTRQVKDAYIWFMARIRSYQNKTGAYDVINIKAKTFSNKNQG